MMNAADGGRAPGADQARPRLPLIRHLSARVTPALARLPVTANQVTAASLASGLGAAWSMMQGSTAWAVAGGALLVLCYVLDNCDGEIARLKRQSSEFGRHFDSFADWLVHAAWFAALGIGVARESGEEVWLWLGWVAALGCTVNYGVALIARRRRHRPAAASSTVSGGAAAPPLRMPRGGGEWLLYSFRELARADFCFLVLVLAVFDLAWVLVPAGAVGAQAYWATRLVRGATEFQA